MTKILIPNDAAEVQEEGELTVVMGRHCKGATKSDALSYVLGYTCGNDVSARQWQRDDLQWWRAKSSDTFAPLGPYIVTDLDPGDLHLQARIGAKVVQDSSTSDLIHDVPTIIEFVSRVMTLDPGDVIMTGTPGATRRPNSRRYGGDRDRGHRCAEQPRRRVVACHRLRPNRRHNTRGSDSRSPSSRTLLLPTDR